MKSSSVWMSFDLGFDGDYENLYHWLDTHSAVECGEHCAFFKFEAKRDAATELKTSLSKSIKFRKKDRVYLIWRKDDGTLKGKFIVGGRRRSPWTGYAVVEKDAVDEG